jgi:hypothetical protein
MQKNGFEKQTKSVCFLNKHNSKRPFERGKNNF